MLQYTLLFKSSKLYFFKEINTFIQQACDEWITRDSKDIVRIFFFFYFLFFKESKKKVLQVQKNILRSTTVSTLIINQYIRMISEGARDTEDWSNG